MKHTISPKIQVLRKKFQVPSYKFQTSGQSLLEVLIAVAVGSLMVIAATSVLTPLLRGSTQATRTEVGAALARELSDNLSVFAESSWHNIDLLSTGSANKYWLSATSSPFRAVTGTESIVISGSASTTYKRDFYIDTVTRDAGGNVSGAGTNDPSTKKVTIEYSWPQSTTSTYVFYLTRYQNFVLDQGDWSGGAGVNGPLTALQNSFSNSTSVDATIPGYLQMALSRPVTIIQKSFANKVGSSVSSTFSSNTAGDLIVVGVYAWVNSTTIPAINAPTDTNNNKYTELLSEGRISDNGTAAKLFYAKNIAGGSNTVTITASSTFDMGMIAVEYSGLSTIAPLDVYTSRADGLPDPSPLHSISTGNVTTHFPKELIVTFGYDEDGQHPWTVDAGYTIEQTSEQPNGYMVFADKTVNVTGTYSNTFSWNLNDASGSDAIIAGIVTFR